MEKRWVLKEQGNPSLVSRLAEELNVSSVIANLLVQRNVGTFEEAREFFRPRLTKLYDPFLMKDMDLAVDRINKAIEANEKVLIYGDYDVDGTTSVALMYSFLKTFGLEVDYYSPNRYSEGYGISIASIEYAEEKGFSLIIALDCGIKAIEKIDLAKQKQIDFIICDHHLPGETIPEAVAVLDPKRIDCTYPFDQLSGCGVGFKLIQGIAQNKNIPFEEIIPYLDLVAISIASDIVPVIDENRILAKFGLDQVNKNPRMGIKSIIEISGLKGKEITINDIVFKIGPRINAAGRMESGAKSVELLISDNMAHADKVSETINNFNTSRKSVDRDITKEALEMISGSEKLLKKKSTVLYNPDWHKGVVGIVASRLIETYYRPTIILTESNGFATGSARSVVGFDLYQAIEECSDLLENFGGHMYAAGLTLKVERIPEFIERFEKIVEENITVEQMVPQIDIDCMIELGDITPKFVRILNQFEPFGPGNMTPVFETQHVVDYGNAKLVGANEEHLRMDLMQEGGPMTGVTAIAFNQPEKFKYIHQGKPFDVCYSIHENNFMGYVTTQLRIKDIKVRD